MIVYYAMDKCLTQESSENSPDTENYKWAINRY